MSSGGSATRFPGTCRVGHPTATSPSLSSARELAASRGRTLDDARPLVRPAAKAGAPRQGLRFRRCKTSQAPAAQSTTSTTAAMTAAATVEAGTWTEVAPPALAENDGSGSPPTTATASTMDTFWAVNPPASPASRANTSTAPRAPGKSSPASRARSGASRATTRRTTHTPQSSCDCCNSRASCGASALASSLRPFTLVSELSTFTALPPSKLSTVVLAASPAVSMTTADSGSEA